MPADLAAAHGMIGVTNLVVRRAFGAGPVLALNAHGDVVPPGAGWSADPYGAEVRDGAMYGRGVAVSKSDFATYAFALQAVAASGASLRGTVELHLTYDEEAGGFLGPHWLLANGVSRPDYAIGAGFSYSVVTAHNGCLHLEVELKGRSAHAALPERGADALEAATRLLTALYGLRDGMQAIRSRVPGILHPTLVVGLISGGINTNVVPDRVTLRLDRRIIPEEDAHAVERELLAVIARAGAGPGIEIVTRRIMLALPFVPRPGQDRLVALIQKHGRAILGADIPAEGVPLFTDARHYSEAGIPTVLYGAGPRSLAEARGHAADERLVLDDLRKATQTVALTIADLLR